VGPYESRRECITYIKAIGIEVTGRFAATRGLSPTRKISIDLESRCDADHLMTTSAVDKVMREYPPEHVTDGLQGAFR
jgi:hypothetical protein